MAPEQTGGVRSQADTTNLHGSARKRTSTPVSRAQGCSQKASSLTTAVQKSDADQNVPLAATTEQKHQAEHFSENVLRAGFLRKVYGILAAQMMLTVGVAVMCVQFRPIQQGFLTMFNSGSQAVQLAMLVPTCVSLMALNCGAKDHFPTNYILLFIFTLSQATLVGYVCTVFEAEGLGHLILTAFALTSCIFIALTLYTLKAGKDMSYLRGYLVTSLVGLVVAGLVAVFVPQIRGNIVISTLGALTFCAYIMFDTWRIEKQFSYDDYIPATIQLYLDILNLFFYILRILSYFGKKSKKK